MALTSLEPHILSGFIPFARATEPANRAIIASKVTVQIPMLGPALEYIFWGPLTHKPLSPSDGHIFCLYGLLVRNVYKQTLNQ
jgi:hypothetical protein